MILRNTCFYVVHLNGVTFPPIVAYFSFVMIKNTTKSNSKRKVFVSQLTVYHREQPGQELKVRNPKVGTEADIT